MPAHVEAQPSGAPRPQAQDPPTSPDAEHAPPERGTSSRVTSGRPRPTPSTDGPDRDRTGHDHQRGDGGTARHEPCSSADAHIDRRLVTHADRDPVAHADRVAEPTETPMPDPAATATPTPTETPAPTPGEASSPAPTPSPRRPHNHRRTPWRRRHTRAITSPRRGGSSTSSTPSPATTSGPGPRPQPPTRSSVLAEQVAVARVVMATDAVTPDAQQGHRSRPRRRHLAYMLHRSRAARSSAGSGLPAPTAARARAALSEPRRKHAEPVISKISSRPMIIP